MTDERMGQDLWLALARLPRGGGVIFRHYATPPGPRRELFERVRRIARRRGLLLLLADEAKQAAAWRADGVHSRSPIRAARPLLRTAPAHNARELTAAVRAGADLAFLSPAFPTRSHPGARALGPVRFGLLIQHVSIPVAALGGMDPRRYRQIRALGAGAWGAIDAWAVVRT